MSQGELNSIFRAIVTGITVLSLVLGLLGGLVPPDSIPDDTPGEASVKNVIFMIGDGMGENHLNMLIDDTGYDLCMDDFPLRGQSMTDAVGGVVTDSAAGGTALACGVRTINGYVGVYPEDPLEVGGYPISLTEYARDNNKKTGVVTTDSTSGATPAAFSAHTNARGNSEDIAEDQISGGFDLVWGKSAGYIDEGEAQAQGVKLVTSYSQLLALTPEDRSYAQFEGDMWSPDIIEGDIPTLTQMTVKAIELLDNDDEGFFLMVEGAHIDKHSHNNEADKMKAALVEFDNAVKAALEFAQEDGETLVIVTADHETGAIELDGEDYAYTSGSHSGDNVPLFVYGVEDFINDGEAIRNKEVSMRTAYAMGASKSDFPKKAA